MANTKAESKILSRTFMYLAFITAACCLVLGGAALWAHNFTSHMVRTELAAQKIYFPEAGSAALDPAEFPDLQKYAGQQVDSPEEAKAYANGFIARHLEKVASGKTYSEVSAEAMKDPTNATLQKQKATLFQGETLRGVLLTSGYGFGTIGTVAGVVTYLAFAAATFLAVLGVALRTRS